MEPVDILLSSTLHFTPLVYFLCATLLILRRKNGDKSRILLALSFMALGIGMFANLIYHYEDIPRSGDGILAMNTLYSMFFAFFATQLYMREVICPGKMNLKGIFIQLSSFLFLNATLLITQPIFRHLSSVDELLTNIQEYNVWLRVIVLASLIPFSFLILYQSYKYSSGKRTILWIRWYSLGIVINTAIFAVWIVTGSVVVRIIFQIICLASALLAAYQELFMRTYPIAEPDEQPQTTLTTVITHQNKIPIPENSSPLWFKLSRLFEEERVWRNPDLTLVELAAKLGTNRTTLSKLIRDNGYDGFSSLINLCRIHEFIQLIQTQEINGIYETFFDVGFRSKSTAIRYFRQVTGTTPSEYLNQTLIKTVDNKKEMH